MPKIKRSADFWAGVLFLGVGIVAFILARNYSIGTARAMGPGYFPFGLGLILALLGAAQIGLSLSGPAQAMSRFAFRSLFLVLAAAATFGLLLRPAGLVVAVLAVVMIGALASPRSRPGSAVLLAIGLAGGSVLVFAYWLGQPLPILGTWFAGS